MSAGQKTLMWLCCPSLRLGMSGSYSLTLGLGNQSNDRSWMFDVFGLSKDCLWSVSGLSLDCLWTISGQRLNFLWTVYGLSLDSRKLDK